MDSTKESVDLEVWNGKASPLGEEVVAGDGLVVTVNSAVPEKSAAPEEVHPTGALPQGGLGDGSAVILQVELASKREARTLQWSVWLLLTLLCFAAIVVVAYPGNRATPRPLTYYRAVLGIASASVFVVVVLGAFFAHRVRQTWVQHKSWDERRKSLAVDAAVLVVLGTINLSCWLAGLAVGTSSGCSWPFKTMAFLAYFRGVTVILIVIWMLAMLSSMSLRRTRAVESDPDHLLLIDAPWQVKLRAHAFKLVLLIIMLVMTSLTFASRLRKPKAPIWIDVKTCGPLPASCKSATAAIVQASITGAIILIASITYIIYGVEARRDHAKLPYSHYRLTTQYVRIQMRNGIGVLLAVVIGSLVVDTAGLGTCAGFIDNQMGAFSAEVAFVLMILVSVYLYMPALVSTASVQAWLQEFCWTQESMESAIADRNKQMVDARATDAGGLEPRLVRIMGLALESAAESRLLLKEPMFCFELSVRLFYFMRLAYQFGNPDSSIKAEVALPLFSLHDIECMHDPVVDTQALLGWNMGGTTLVLAFRGTASTSNVWTDLRWRKGMMVKVHTGFYRAWTDNGFRDKFMARVKELVGECKSPRILLTGHSLGGALASLAAMEVAEAFPGARISVYTYGAPRVGNIPFASEYNARVPDSWAIINNQDPVPRIPKIGFKSVGKRVTITRTGDIIVRPSYFELSILMRSGGTVTHHLTGNYALALAAILKAQFYASKRLPGGEAGARALASAIDLGTTLVLEGVDPASLEDPTCQTSMAEKQVKREETVRKRSRMESLKARWGLGGGRGSAVDFDRQTSLPPEEEKMQVASETGAVEMV